MEHIKFNLLSPKVFVYRNLQRNCWSVKALDGHNKGRVVLHCTAIQLEDAKFTVSEKGRQRVILEKQKNVHAGVVGMLSSANVVSERYPVMPNKRTIYEAFVVNEDHGMATYNPYKGPHFTDVDTGDAILGTGYSVTFFDNMKVRWSA